MSYIKSLKISKLQTTRLIKTQLIFSKHLCHKDNRNFKVELKNYQFSALLRLLKSIDF